jgi:hypothetical protein
MRKDIDEIDVEFNFRAKETFYMLYSRFNAAVEEIKRTKDENVFQQACAQYRFALKCELEKIAMAVIENNMEIQEANLLRRNLTNRINDYLQEFMIKSQSM